MKLKIIKELKGLFTKKKSIPLLIIKKGKDDNVKEYKTIEEAIADLEKDPNVPADKIEKIKSSFNNLKNKTTIRIRNGEIIK